MATETEHHAPAQVPELRPWRFTAQDYHRMGEIGILGPDDRVELIEGEIIQMSPIGDRHAGRTIVLNRTFTLRLGQRAYVSVQNPVRLSERSEPQPDLVIMRASSATHAVRAPRPEDVLLLIEIADTTVFYDRELKVPLYAAAGIPETWLLDLPADRLRVYRGPEGREYRSVQILARGSTVAPMAFPDIEIAIDEILG
jgi:Uma2 family endonuclease